MKSNEMCTRHKNTNNSANDKDYRLTMLCLHKNCADKFKLCCMKCRGDLHKDHAIKLLSIA
jgi:hypothetical protein